MELRHDELKKDLDAAVETRKELGQEYESEIIDSFLSRIDARLDSRVEQRVAERLAQYGAPPYLGRPGDHHRRGRERSPGPRFQLFSLAVAIPLSGIGASTSGLAGLLVVWGGILGVNFAASFSENRGRRQEREAQRRRRDGWE